MIIEIYMFVYIVIIVIIFKQQIMKKHIFSIARVIFFKNSYGFLKKLDEL